MNYSINTHNMLQLQGNVAAVREYSEGKAASITIAVSNGRGKDGSEKPPYFIQLKNFNPASYNAARVGMKVRVYGHVQTARYERDGETVHTTDLVADVIDFLESRATVEAREERKNKEGGDC